MAQRFDVCSVYQVLLYCTGSCWTQILFEESDRLVDMLVSV